MHRSWLDPWQALAVDVVVGVMAGAALAVHVTGATMHPAWWLLLALTTWALYSADRLMDARRVGARAGSYRHRFFGRHAIPLTAGVLMAAIVAPTAAVVFLPRRSVLVGALIGTCGLVYLVLAQRFRRRFPKELVAAGIYAAGIWFGPLVERHEPLAWSLAAAGFHALAAWLNLVQFGVFEVEMDRRDGHGSIACALGVETARGIVRRTTALAAPVLVSAALIAPAPARSGLWVLLPVVLIPWTLDRGSLYFGRRARYRIWGDLAFATLALPYVSALFRG